MLLPLHAAAQTRVDRNDETLRIGMHYPFLDLGIAEQATAAGYTTPITDQESLEP